MDTGVTLFLEDNFRRAKGVTDHTDYSEFSADRSDRPSIPWKVEICLSCTSNTGHRCYLGEHWRGQMEGVDERTEECRATDEVCEKRKMK